MNKEELINVLSERKTDVEALEESFKAMKTVGTTWDILKTCKNISSKRVKNSENRKLIIIYNI